MLKLMTRKPSLKLAGLTAAAWLSVGAQSSLAADATKSADTSKSDQVPSDTIDVSGKAIVPDALYGSYRQPVWTTRRVFPTTRSYVIPAGNLTTELWIKAHKYRDGTPNDYLIQEEIEYGLPGRIQLDLYINQKNEVRDGKRLTDHEGEQYELRWAMADWGVLPLNPTWYFEYHARKNNPAKGEVRLLLSETLAPNLHASANLAYEQELWGVAKERELAVTAALGTTAFVSTLSIGAEVKSEWVDTSKNRGHFHPELVVGPSLQWRPTPATHIDLAPLFGVQKDAPQIETWLIVGHNLR